MPKVRQQVRVKALSRNFPQVVAKNQRCPGRQLLTGKTNTVPAKDRDPRPAHSPRRRQLRQARWKDLPHPKRAEEEWGPNLSQVRLNPFNQRIWIKE
jgi:hypothetical protein